MRQTRKYHRLKAFFPQPENKKMLKKAFPIQILLLILLIFLISGSMPCAESLWNPDFKGYIFSASSLKVGDILLVTIDAGISLSHVSAMKDSKTITFEYSGGEYGDLFSFLPNVTTGTDKTSTGNEKYSLKTEMVARVISLEKDNYGLIKGVREVEIDGKKESIAVSGYVNARDIDQQGRIDFSRIADSSLVFRTFLSPKEDVLTGADIEELFAEMTGTESVELTGDTIVIQPTPEPGTGTAVSAAEPTPAPQGSIQTAEKATLSREKKKELFLRYLNRMIDLLFN